jgi:hypothetical protein
MRGLHGYDLGARAEHALSAHSSLSVGLSGQAQTRDERTQHLSDGQEPHQVSGIKARYLSAGVFLGPRYYVSAYWGLPHTSALKWRQQSRKRPMRVLIRLNFLARKS